MKPAKPKPSAVVSGGTEVGFTLKKLRADDFHEIVGLVERVKTCPPDSAYGPSFTRLSVGDSIITPDGHRGTISGFAVENDVPTPFARVGGRLFHVSTLKRA